MNILITGGCGYVGTVLTETLLNDGHKINVIDTQWFGNHLKEHPNLINIKGDIRNFDFEKFDYNPYEDLPSDPLHLYYSNYSIIFFGLIFGSLLFLVIIFLNLSVVNKKNNFSSKNYL